MSGNASDTKAQPQDPNLKEPAPTQAPASLDKFTTTEDNKSEQIQKPQCAAAIDIYSPNNERAESTEAESKSSLDTLVIPPRSDNTPPGIRPLQRRATLDIGTTETVGANSRFVGNEKGCNTKEQVMNNPELGPEVVDGDKTKEK